MTKPYTSENRYMFFFLVALAVACALGFQGWRTLLNNFAVDRVGLTGQQMGVVQGMREIPGFLAFVVIYVLMIISEHRLAAISLVIMGLGISLTGILPSFYGLIFTTITMSFGFHYYETVNQSLTLQHFSPTQVPVVMGKVRAAMAASNIAVGAMVFGLAYILDFGALFALIGGAVAMVALGALWVNPTPKNTVPQKKRMVLRSRYWLFYALTFMAGARRQIFVAFAVFLLVEKFGFTVQEIAILFLVNNLINYFLAPQVGKAINRFGERAVLTTEYFSLMVIFLIYAFTDSKAVVAAAYVLDHIFFNCSIAIPSFFRKIADPDEVAPSMAVGFTINHIVAVVIPIIGGMIWMLDYRITFIGGTGLAFISLLLSQMVSSQTAKAAVKPGSAG